jgi:hypothetical protein
VAELLEQHGPLWVGPDLMERQVGVGERHCHGARQSRLRRVVKGRLDAPRASACRMRLKRNLAGKQLCAHLLV